MQRRSLVMLIGEKWYLTHVSDLFETMSAKYTSENQPRGVLSLFKKTKSSRYYKNPPQDTVSDLHEYLRDEQSNLAFTQPLEANTELKIYLVGHGYSGCHTLASLNKRKDFIFRINVQALANRLHALFHQLQVAPTAACPVKITLVACASAMNSKKEECLAAQLLEQLNLLGHNHIMVNAYERKVFLTLAGRITNGKIVHFYLEDNHIYRVYKNADLRRQVLKVLKKVNTSDYINTCINQFTAIGFSKPEQLQLLQTILAEKNLDNDTATQLQQLHNKAGSGPTY